MPRQNRVSVGDTVYHVINRSNGRVKIFNTDADYRHFEGLLEEGRELTGMRILSYCIMPNHWHLVLYPKNDTDMGEFMRWVTTTHVRQRRVATESVGEGHLYQGTYKSFPVETDKHLVDLIRYVEQNPLRAKLVKNVQDWKWSSLWRREIGTIQQRKILSKLPTVLPSNYLSSVSEIYNTDKLEKVRYSVNKGMPYGSEKWVSRMIKKYRMENTTRMPGRPKRNIIQ
ncbi:MAG: transposase [Minisyncoccia bacterium]